ncbi:Penicillin-binding protein 4* [Planctomycetes bacterium K23_9]|uniref:Penicillin-binding protein 4 n=2 Tax=Stieleria marina TaxID=1930275 RepID=A0A517NVW7_9BACT|nr:Penicillin-binding protein 4* [Planctomycetes bacterium K23_9]
MKATFFLSTLLSVSLCMFASETIAQESSLPDQPAPGLVPTDSSDPRFATVTPLVSAAIADGQTPGAVVVLANADKVLYASAFGDRQVQPTVEPMTLDTVFDLASISKPVGTATSVMVLVDEGKIDVNEKVATYLPEFGQHGKDEITVDQLLVHTAGLIPDNALGDYQHGIDEAWDRICNLKLRSAPGEKFAYTDVGFIVLGKLVQKISGRRLDAFAAERVFGPLGMTETMYNPPAKLCERAATTETRDGKPMKGVVHDPRAFLMDGVAGHAGVFSTAADLVRYGQAMLRKGKLADATGDSPQQLFTAATFDLMTKPRDIKRGTRTYGWDNQSPYSRNRGKSLSPAAFGHGGFTGTVMWIDPAKELVFIFLSTRLHPDGKGSVNDLAGQISTDMCKDW